MQQWALQSTLFKFSIITKTDPGVQIFRILSLQASKRQTTKFTSADLKKFIFPSFIILRIKDQRANSVDLDEMAHYEPPHLDLRCLQI